METLGKILLIGIGAVLKGISIAALWGWFIVPIFEIRYISVAEGVGLGLLISYVTYKRDKEDEEEYSTLESLASVVFHHIKTSVMVLFFGWIVSMFI